MAASPKATDTNQELSWTSPQRRPRPQPIQAQAHDVSRNSGLNCTTGTFGLSARFSDKLSGRGTSSPSGRDFYKRNPLYKTELERGLECTFGFGDRPELALKMQKNVGPGSYDIMASAAQRKSPLDGPDYCTMTMHGKLPSKLVPRDLCSPGPHHKYEIRKPLDHHCPQYHVEPMTHGGRHAFSEDRDQPGPGQYAVTHHKSVASSASAPDLSSTAPGKSRTVKSTFGTADRFRSTTQTSSPEGSYFYAHFKPWDKEDYLTNSRSCTFGKDTKTDFANPLRGPVFQVSPVSYSPVTSIAYKTSALDGLTSRLESPIRSACRSSSRPGRPTDQAGEAGVGPGFTGEGVAEPLAVA